MNQEEMIRDIHRKQGELGASQVTMIKRQDEMIRDIHRHTVQIDALFETVQDHTRRLERLEENVLTKADGRKMMEMLDFLVLKMTKMSDDHDAAIEWLKRHEERFHSHETRIGRLEAHPRLA